MLERNRKWPGTIITVTVNKRRIESNAETGKNKPVLCVNKYAGRITHGGRAYWGRKIGTTEHLYEYSPLVNPMSDIKIIYDPVNKTPCGASCWVDIHCPMLENLEMPATPPVQQLAAGAACMGVA